MISSSLLEGKLKALKDKDVLISRTENNQYLKVSYRGAGGLISEKWNVKIYTSGSVVCNDMVVLEDILHDRLKKADVALKVIQADDAGIGFPLGGVMIGLTDGSKVITGIVETRYFQTPLYEEKKYLQVYASMGLDLLLKEFQVTPWTHRIELCSGYVNTGLRDLLREKQFDVRIVEIKGLLQEMLEGKFKAYIKGLLGADMAYDPKEFEGNAAALARKYYAVVDWGRKYCPAELKTGWGSLQ